MGAGWCLDVEGEVGVEDKAPSHATAGASLREWFEADATWATHAAPQQL